jgi:hypothetical protein
MICKIDSPRGLRAMPIDIEYINAVMKNAFGVPPITKNAIVK